MDQLHKFADLLFKGLPEDAEKEQAKEIVQKRLEAEYSNAVQEGMEAKQAFMLTMACFGALEGATAQYRHQKLLSAYRQFRKKYPIMVRCGLLGLIFVPVLFLVLFSSLDSKPVALAGWILSLLGLISFVIWVEYTDYRYKKLLEQHRPVDSDPEDIEKELATANSFHSFRDTSSKVPHSLPPSQSTLSHSATIGRDHYPVTQQEERLSI